MDQPCQHCGAYHAPEARFCRTCGAPLDNAAAQSGPISPRAQTIPLTNEARPTGGLAAAGNDPHISYDTSRVGLSEMEKLLRRPQAQRPVDEQVSSQPLMSALPIAARRESDTLVASSVVAPQQIPAVEIPRAPAPPPSRTRTGLLVALLVVVSLALGVGLLAVFFSHRALSSNNTTTTNDATASATTTAPAAPVTETNAGAVAENQEPTSSEVNRNESAPAIELAVPASDSPSTALRDKNETARDAQRNAARDRLINPPAQHAPASTANAAAIAPSQLSANARTPSASSIKPESPAGNNADAPYLRAFNVVNGRDLKKLSQAELISALIEFQKAARGGAHQEQARKYADLLGKEFDRRKNWTK